MAKVSVIIPSYNSAAFIDQTIASVMALTHAPHEVIVVDDGSNDGTPDLVAQMAGVVLIQQENGGDSAARNTGLAASSGDYIMFLDHDDLLLPQAATHHLAAMNSGAYDMVYGANVMINSVGEIVGENRHQPREFDTRDVALGAATPSFSQCMYRRSSLERIGGFHPPAGAAADHDLNIRLLWGEGRGFMHGEMVMKYRLHEGQQTKSPTRLYRIHMQVLERLLGSGSERTDLELLRKAQTYWQAYYGKFLPSEAARMTLKGRPLQAISAFALFIKLAPRSVPSAVRYWIRQMRG